MFKVISNVGSWETLYCSASASKHLRAFELGPGWSEGVFGGIAIRRIASDPDYSKRGSRTRDIVLLAQKPDLAPTIALSLRVDCAPQLEKILCSEKLSLAGEEHVFVQRYCERLEQELGFAGRGSASQSDSKLRYAGAAVAIAFALSLIWLQLLNYQTAKDIGWQLRTLESRAAALEDEIRRDRGNISNLTEGLEKLGESLQQLRAAHERATKKEPVTRAQP